MDFGFHDFDCCHHLCWPLTPADCSTISAGQSPEETVAIPLRWGPFWWVLHWGATNGPGAVHQQVSLFNSPNTTVGVRLFHIGRRQVCLSFVFCATFVIRNAVWKQGTVESSVVTKLELLTLIQYFFKYPYSIPQGKKMTQHWGSRISDFYLKIDITRLLSVVHNSIQVNLLLEVMGLDRRYSSACVKLLSERSRRKVEIVSILQKMCIETILNNQPQYILISY